MVLPSSSGPDAVRVDELQQGHAGAVRGREQGQLSGGRFAGVQNAAERYTPGLPLRGLAAARDGAGLWPQPLKGARSIEQIGMGSSPNQDESIVLLVPDQQPVRFDVTFPARRPVPGQPMLPMSWVERLIRQKSLHDTPELVEILAALSATLEILLESLRGKQAHWNQPCRALRSSKLVYSVSPSPVRACRNAAMVSALGTFTANGKP